MHHRRRRGILNSLIYICGGVCGRTLDLEVRGSSLVHRVVSLDKELYSTLSLFTPTSSPGRFSLALEVGRPTSEAREKCPGDEVVFTQVPVYKCVPETNYWAGTVSKVGIKSILTLQLCSSPCPKDQFAVLYFIQIVIVLFLVYTYEIRHQSTVYICGLAAIQYYGNLATEHPVQGGSSNSPRRHAKETGTSSGCLGLWLVWAFTLYLILPAGIQIIRS